MYRTLVLPVTVKVSNGGYAGTMTAGRILLPLATGAIMISPHELATVPGYGRHRRGGMTSRWEAIR